MYTRIYPSANNTLFKLTSGPFLLTSGNVNTGKNPKFELRDGNSDSIIVMGFDLTEIKSLLVNYNFTCNLKMWDCGVGFDPTLKDLKNVNLYYFLPEFVEGDGFSFNKGHAIEGVSNWNKRNSVDNWAGCFTQGLIPAMHLQSANQDIEIKNIESFIRDAINLDKNPNFGIQLETNTWNEQIFAKLLYSRHTRTIFKPYLEFFIDNDILFDRQDITATFANKIYLVNHNYESIVGAPTCVIKDEDGNVVFTPTTITNAGQGIYHFDFTPSLNQVGKNFYDIWSIDGVPTLKGVLQITSPNVFKEDVFSDLYFFPTTYYQRPLIPKGDLIKINLQSQTSSQETVLFSNYEYKVLCTNSFEMSPWQPVNLYDNKLFFYIDTSYYFEEIEYEIFVRLKLGKRVQTSPSTYKFRVTYPGPTHLDGVAASPYNNRDVFLKRGI